MTAARWHFYRPQGRRLEPEDYDGPGVGGSEAALVLVTRALAERGHDVHVFTNCPGPGADRGVRWSPSEDVERAGPADVLVSVRGARAVLPERYARHRVFWMLDHDPAGPGAFCRRHVPGGGRVVVASRAMQDVLVAAGVRGPTVLIPHPVPSELFALDLPRELACVYCSVPDRGLDVALDVWPAVRRRVPGARLIVTSGYELWGQRPDEARRGLTAAIGGTAVPEGVELAGVVSRSELHRLQATASLMLYPCRYPEMFCLSAAECAAAGTPAVTSATGALRERVQHGVTGLLVPGDPAGDEARRAFADAVAGLLRDPARRAAMGAAARRLAAPSLPARVASQWEALLPRA